MKTYDATEAAYKNGFNACAEKLRKFRPGDTVSVSTNWGKKTGVVTDWLTKDMCPDVMYLVRIGTRDEYYAAAYRANELELVKRPFFESEEPEPVVSETVLEARGCGPVPFVSLHDDVTDGDIMIRVDTIEMIQNGVVVTSNGTWCVKETAEETMGYIQKTWEVWDGIR